MRKPRNKDKRFESEKMELEPEDALEQEDSISQLDGGADPVCCNLCSATFEGRNKGINLLSHKINEHFKDAFRREVEDVTRIDGLLIHKSSMFSGGHWYSGLKTACCFAEDQEWRLFW